MRNEIVEFDSFSNQKNANRSDSTSAVNIVSESSIISNDDERENEDPEESRSHKRKNSSRDYIDVDKSKILKKDTTSKASSSSETAVPLAAITNENADVHQRSPSYSNNHAKDYFSLLPDEVLLLIFKAIQHKPTLVNCACVCRRWKNVAFDIDLWYRIELSQRRIEPGIMKVVLSKKPVILRMSQTKVISPILRYTRNLIGKIEYLDLSMASISMNDLELLLQTCCNLLKLSLEYVNVNDAICKEISKNSKLTVLNLSQSGGLDEHSLKIILTNCEKLTELNVAWTGLSAAAIEYLCLHVPKYITCLNLSGCVREMTDNHIQALALRCPRLKELDLSDATGITEKSIKPICDNLNNLEILSLSRCYNINPSNYSKLFRLPSIAFINIFGLFSDAQIETLRKTSHVKLNMMKFSHVARPTVGNRRTSIWSMQVRD